LESGKFEEGSPSKKKEESDSEAVKKVENSANSMALFILKKVG
jgi:hypothetical protein